MSKFQLEPVTVEAVFQGYMEVNGPPCFLFRHPQRPLCRLVAGLYQADSREVCDHFSVGKVYTIVARPGEMTHHKWSAELS